AGLSLTGTGALQVIGGTVTLNTPLACDALPPIVAVSNGTLNGAGALTVDSAFACSGGTLTGAGVLTTNAASPVTGAPILDGKTWNNAGTLTIGPGSDRLQLVNNAIFNNQAAGTEVISLTNANTFVHASGASSRS